MADTTPDPHRDEPLPESQEGMRPEAVASGVRPEQDEPGGPLPGLLSTASAEVAEEVTDSPEAEEQLDAAGVEEEGIESGQIMGITLAILVTVALLAGSVFWFFYAPKLDATEDTAEGQVELAPEGQLLNAQAQAQLGDYGMKADSTYTLPIGVAMEDVARSYASGTAEAALSGEAVAGATPLAATRAGFNVAPIELAPRRAVRAASSRGAMTAPVPETATDAPSGVSAQPTTDEEVGVDGDALLTLPRTDSDE
ncbi:hypothetical protein [Rubricoccus marinus]|uniref:Uncharacterized protein n=1 Tax=Rubricoccus marinus TaxID=716817 RepID=A0A259TZX3_9BACT|nr:hypothetical protein [Rubricoccus marinus]OZC03236.1 hypothetical protein BSZ36_09765 [Rubricoccus marinus]